MRGGIFSRFWAARQSRGRSRRARSRANAAAHRYAHHVEADERCTGPHRGVPARFEAIGLDRWSQCSIRLSSGAGVATTSKHAAELVALAPDVIFANGSATMGPLLQATRIVPIVFAIVPDPVGAGYVESLARPGGNATGFTSSNTA